MCSRRSSVDGTEVSCVHGLHGATHRAVYEGPQHLQQVQTGSPMLPNMQRRVFRNQECGSGKHCQKYPCDNRQSGCLELFSIEQIGKHHAACVYGKLKCPLHLLKKCSWNGLKNDLKEHVKAAHNECFYIVSTFRSDLYEDRICLITQFRELFGQYKRIQDGRFYSAVQLIGTSSEASKYKCKFTLSAENGIEHIIHTFLVHGYSEDLETIFNSGKCLCLDEAVVRNFMAIKWVKLHIELSKVE